MTHPLEHLKSTPWTIKRRPKYLSWFFVEGFDLPNREFYSSERDANKRAAELNSTSKFWEYRVEFSSYVWNNFILPNMRKLYPKKNHEL